MGEARSRGTFAERQAAPKGLVRAALFVQSQKARQVMTVGLKAGKFTDAAGRADYEVYGGTLKRVR